ncbi:MAG: AGE family epimerase/isomerase [Pseudomonadota bacterium]
MRVYPVIMCGGIGTRLWPLSRKSRPKQFVNLVGDTSLFQETVARLIGLNGFERLVVITGQTMQTWVSRQLALNNASADILLEPAGRDSAAAVALAAIHIHTLDPEGVIVLVASDHFIPDAAHFRAEIDKAVAGAANGSIVTLGIKPTAASDAYGYIQPGETQAQTPVRKAIAFREKPDVETAARYISEGYLWNSGNFIARADALMDQLSTHAPDVIEPVQAGYDSRSNLGNGTLIGDAFLGAKKTPIDKAVMEKTQDKSVLPTDLDWSDLGAWDAVHAVNTKDKTGNSFQGRVILHEATNCAARGPDDKLIVLAGVDGLNVVADDDVILVTPLAQSNALKNVTDRLAQEKRGELDIPSASATVGERTQRLLEWWETAALPLWFSNGFDHTTGLWRESLHHTGHPTLKPVRGRVPGRQTYVFAQAGRDQWAGPWNTVLDRALTSMAEAARPYNGLMPPLLDARGEALQDSFNLYDQTFQLLALAHAPSSVKMAQPIPVQTARPLQLVAQTVAKPTFGGMEDAGAFAFTHDNATAYDRALGLLTTIEQQIFGKAANAAPRLSEMDETCPHRSNPVMHLFEAALAWIETSRQQGRDDRPWMALADEIATLCEDKLMNGPQGHISELYDGDWNALPITDENRIETGHQFEWAWLLMKWQKLSASNPAESSTQNKWHDHAKRLFAVGSCGTEPRALSMVNYLDGNYERCVDKGRFWCQLEWLKAALVLYEAADERERAFYLSHAELALDVTEAFLNTPVRGLWYDKRKPDGTFVDEDVPASTLYHITSALTQLRETTARHRDI